MRNSLYLVFITIFLNSCAFHSGLMTGNASLTNGDFQVVELAVGHATASYFLGVGGLKTDAIVLEAKKDMLRNYPLKQGQVLANITVDFKRGYYVLYYKTYVTVSADVIEFTIPKEAVFDPINAANLSTSTQGITNFSIGDSILILKGDKPKKAEISGFYDNRIQAKYLGVDNREYTHDYQYKEVLKRESSTINIELYGFDVGEKVKAQISKSQLIEAVIFGINGYQAGVKFDFQEDGSFSWKILDLSGLRKL